MLKYYVCWLLLMSAVTFFLMGWDKLFSVGMPAMLAVLLLLGAAVQLWL